MVQMVVDTDSVDEEYLHLSLNCSSPFAWSPADHHSSPTFSARAKIQKSRTVPARLGLERSLVSVVGS